MAEIEVLGDGLDKTFDIREELTNDGLYFKDGNGKQGFIPKSKNEDYWKLTEDQKLNAERWTKEAQRDYPNADPTTVEFMINFYIKYPEEYRRIVKERPPSKVDSFDEMRKKYEEVDNHGNKMYDLKNFDAEILFLDM